VASSDPRIQLRFTYQPPEKSLRIHGVVRGMFAELTPEDGDLQTAQAYLHFAGVHARPDASSLLVAASDLGLLLSLPERVVLLADADLATILRCSRSTVEPPVLVTMDGPQTLNLNWIDETGECNEPLNVRSASALLAANVPLSASAETWDLLVSSRALPLSRARARLNLDGFVEVTTALGRHVESVAIPGLFKIDTGRYGLTASLGHHAASVPGLLWEGPRTFSRERTAPARSLPLGPHSAPLLEDFLRAIEVSRAAIVHSPPGSGRRVFSLAACESLRAFPVTILCRPAGLWLWHRHVDLLGGRTEDADVNVISYDAFMSGSPVGEPGALILDDLDLAFEERPSLAAALHSLDGSTADFRIAVLRREPSSDQDLLTVLAAIRPAEFAARVPLQARYPGDFRARFREHAGEFLHALPAPTSAQLFKSSQVLEIEPGSALLELLASARLTGPGSRHVRHAASEVLSWCSSGSSGLLGPKVSAVLAMRPDKGTAIVTRIPRTAQILSDLGVPAKGATLLDPLLPLRDLSDFERVLLLEPPFSYRDLDRAVVEASDSRGVREVIVLHSPGTPDDRAAEVAFARRSCPDGVFTLEEASFVAGICGYREFLSRTD